MLNAKIVKFYIEDNEFSQNYIYFGIFENIGEMNKFIFENNQVGNIVTIQDIVSKYITYELFNELAERIIDDKLINLYLA